MRPRTATIGSVSFNVARKKNSQPNSPKLGHEEPSGGETTPPYRKTSLFDSFRPRSKSDATRKLSHRRIPIVSTFFVAWSTAWLWRVWEVLWLILNFAVSAGSRPFTYKTQCISVTWSLCQSWGRCSLVHQGSTNYFISRRADEVASIWIQSKMLSIRVKLQAKFPRTWIRPGKCSQ